MVKIMLTCRSSVACAQVSGGLLTAGAKGITVECRFDEAWNGLTPRLVCKCGTVTKPMVIDLDNMSEVPWECLISGRRLEIGVDGIASDGSVRIPTIWADCGRVMASAADAGPAPEPSPDLVEQIHTMAYTAAEQASEARAAADDLIRRADAGEFDGSDYDHSEEFQRLSEEMASYQHKVEQDRAAIDESVDTAAGNAESAVEAAKRAEKAATDADTYAEQSKTSEENAASSAAAAKASEDTAAGNAESAVEAAKRAEKAATETASQTSEMLADVKKDIDSMSYVRKLGSSEMTIRNGYFNNKGIYYNSSIYEVDIINLETVGNVKSLVITARANKVARLAVFFSGDPDIAANLIGTDGIEYDSSMDVYTLYEDAEIPIPDGAKYVCCNCRLQNVSFSVAVSGPGQSNRITGQNSARLDAIEPDVAESKANNARLYGEYTLSDSDFSLVNGYFNKQGSLTNSSTWCCRIVSLQALGKIDAIIETATATSAARLAVFFSGDPLNGGSFIKTDSLTYLPSYANTPFFAEELIIPDNADYVCLNYVKKSPVETTVKGQGMAIKSIAAYVQQARESMPPYVNKRILYMGDSITALGTGSRGWPGMFHTAVCGDTYVNVAVSGATWTDYPGTVLDGNPVSNGADNNINNTISNQVAKIAQLKASGSDVYQAFDAIMIAAGTNDGIRDEGLDTQFFVDNVLITLDSLNRQTWAGAVRYAYERIRDMYPDAVIFICSPIQANEVSKKYASTVSKRIALQNVCDRLSDVVFVDTFSCGICNIFEEQNGAGRDLIDGLHPNASGAQKIAKYNANAFVAHFMI